MNHKNEGPEAAMSKAETTRILPNDEAGERASIAAVITGYVLASAFTHVDPAIYYLPEHQVIVAEIRDMGIRNEQVNLDTLRRSLEDRKKLEKAGGIVYLAGLCEPTGNIDIEATLAAIREKADLRNIIYSAEALTAAAWDGKGDLRPVIGDAISVLSSFSDDHKQGAFIPPAHWQSYDVADIHKWTCPEIEPIIDGILAKGNLLWLAAETQTGKTLFMLWICLKLLDKGSLFDKFAITPVKRILYVACEDPARRFKDRLMEMTTGAIESGRFTVYVASGLSLVDVLCFQFLENMIREGGFDLVVIDTWQAATPGIASFDDEKLSIVIQHLLGITRNLGTTIIVNDHFRKSLSNKKRTHLDLNDVKGTGGKLQNADVYLLMDRDKGQLRISGKSKEWDRPIGFLLDIAPQGSEGAEKFTYAGDLEQMAGSMKQLGEENRQKVLEALPSNDWVTCTQIAKVTGLSERTVTNHLKKLEESRKVLSNGEKGKAIRYQSGKGIAQGELALCANAISDIGSSS